MGMTNKQFQGFIRLAKLATDSILEKANDPDWLCFAVGYYHDATDGDLRLALRYADERMYKDKKAFYEMHPEKRR